MACSGDVAVTAISLSRQISVQDIRKLREQEFADLKAAQRSSCAGRVAEVILGRVEYHAIALPRLTLERRDSSWNGPKERMGVLYDNRTSFYEVDSESKKGGSGVIT